MKLNWWLNLSNFFVNLFLKIQKEIFSIVLLCIHLLPKEFQFSWKRGKKTPRYAYIQTGTVQIQNAGSGGIWEVALQTWQAERILGSNERRGRGKKKNERKKKENAVKDKIPREILKKKKEERKARREGARSESTHGLPELSRPQPSVSPPVAAPRRSPRPVPARTRRHARPGRAPRALRGSPRPCAWLCVWVCPRPARHRDAQLRPPEQPQRKVVPAHPGLRGVGCRRWRSGSLGWFFPSPQKARCGYSLFTSLCFCNPLSLPPRCPRPRTPHFPRGPSAWGAGGQWARALPGPAVPPLSGCSSTPPTPPVGAALASHPAPSLSFPRPVTHFIWDFQRPLIILLMYVRKPSRAAFH